jgi:hypothetical protein
VARAVDLDVAVADLDALGVLDRHVALPGPRAGLVDQLHQGLGDCYEVGVVARVEVPKLIASAVTISVIGSIRAAFPVCRLYGKS